MSRGCRLLFLVLVVLTCLTLLTSAFEVGRKKPDTRHTHTSHTLAHPFPPHSHQTPTPPSPPPLAPPSPSPTPAAAKERKSPSSTSKRSAAPPAAAASASIAADGTAEVEAAAPGVSRAARAAPSASAEVYIDSPISLHLEHDVTGDDRWTSRGTVEVTFASSGSTRSGAKFSEVKLSAEDQAKLKALAASDGFYRIRARGNATDGQRYIVASSKACALLASSLHEHWVLHFDIHGHLLSISHSTPITHCPPSLPSPIPSTFVSKAKLSFGRTGEKPSNVRLRLQPGEAGAPVTGPAGEGGEGAQEQSFFAKYWMYIVPFGAFMLLQGLIAPAEKKEGEGGAPRAGGAAAPARSG